MSDVRCFIGWAKSGEQTLIIILGERLRPDLLDAIQQALKLPLGRLLVDGPSYCVSPPLRTSLGAAPKGRAITAQASGLG